MRREVQTCLCGRRSRPEDQSRVPVGAGLGGEHDFALVNDNTIGQRGALLTPPQAPEGAPRRPPGHPRHAVPGGVGGVGDQTTIGRYRTHEGVGVRVSEGGRDPVLLLHEQPIPRLTGPQVQGIAGVQEQPRGGLEVTVGDVSQPRRGDGAQDRQLTQSPEGLLDVGLQQVGDLALPLPPLVGGRPQFVHAFGSEAAPVGPDRRHQLLHQELVARHGSGVQESQHHFDVLGGQPAGLGQSPHRVIQLDLAVPHGVPDAVGKVPHRTFVQQEQIEVAPHGKLSPAVPADGDQGRPAPFATGESEQLLQPVVRQGDQRTTAPRTWWSGAPQQLSTRFDVTTGGNGSSRAPPCGRPVVAHLVRLTVRPRRAHRCALAQRCPRVWSTPCRHRSAPSGRS